MSNKIADVATTVSGIGATTSITLSEVNQLVSIIAGIVAIISGICAAVYYIKRSREVGRDNKNKGNK